jgi:hypothetical protein
MAHRFFSVCTLVALLIAISPILLPEPIEIAASAPIAPLNPDAVCLYVPSAARSNSASSTAWQFEPSMPTPRHSFGFVWLPATYNAYALGGMLGWQEAVTATERYDACPRLWATMAPLLQPRGYVQAAELNDKLYVVGGVDRVISDTYQVHNETWVYDPIDNTWSRAANFPQTLGGVALAVVNNRLYAFGGFDARGPNGGDVADTYVYNPATNSWSNAAPLLDGVHSPGVAVLPDAFCSPVASLISTAAVPWTACRSSCTMPPQIASYGRVQ